MRTDPTRRPGWVPPHCPNPPCHYHLHDGGPWPYIRKGFYRRASDGVRIQRFQCKNCRISFSSQTFSTSYWLKRPHLTSSIFPLAIGCMAIRQMARTLSCGPDTVCRHIARIARHAMLWMWMHQKNAPVRGPLVFDGLRSFEFSQFHPIEHHVLIEKNTSFILFHTDSELRRSGTMTPYQKWKRREIEARLGKPDPRAVFDDVTELLRVGLQPAQGPLVLHSDEHRVYERVIRKLARETGLQVVHRQTSSKQRRTAHNPLFEINLLDLLVRHTQANHKRETIAYSKRRQGSAERLICLQLWRNWIHKRRENGPWLTPAMLKGLIDRPLKLQEIYHSRLFPGRIPLPARWTQYYRRTVQTREYANNRRHALEYAF